MYRRALMYRPGFDVTVLAAHVPVSVWTLVATVAGVAASLLVWRPLARRRCWHPGATLAALLLFTVAFALTLTPDGDQPAMGCTPASLPA
jgi:hypothetical protein